MIHPLLFETARERDDRICRDREAAKAAARAELGEHWIRRFRHLATGEVTEFLDKPGAADRFFANRSASDFEETDAPAGAVEMVEQHWGQA